MSKMKRLATSDDVIVQVDIPFTEKELTERNDLYDTLTPKKFKQKFQEGLFLPASFTLNGKKFSLQVNKCANPFCKNFGKEQENYLPKKNRYSLVGTDRERGIRCKQDPNHPNEIPSLECYTRTMSNWSLASEIERLVQINSVVPVEPDYVFHKDSCPLSSTPFTEPKDFYKRGVSTSKSQKYQCKTCKKYTNILPDKTRNTGYQQQRNDILPQFAMHLINRVPVVRTCDILGIGRSTYYSKLEWLYRCCLEFLEAKETKAFAKKEFSDFWVETDKMMYVLNNVRKKGQRNTKKHIVLEKQLPTQIVVSTEHYTRYVLRADVCFDWNITQDQVHFDTELFKDDHLNDYLSKNGKFTRYGIHPMPPSKNDTQSYSEFKSELDTFEKRFQYVDGLHTNHTYTTIAHYFLIKQLISTNKWRIITDDDFTLFTAINHIFSDEMKRKQAYLFVSKVNKTLSRKDAFLEYQDSLRNLKEWGEKKGLSGLGFHELSLYYLIEQLDTHTFHNTHTAPDGSLYTSYAKNPIEHPIGMKDRGKRAIDCLTDMSHLPTNVLAKFMNEVNDNSVNGFLQQIRRSISTLERPLSTSRGDGRSYIYSNFNPKYAQMSITILRTYYNFCKPYRIGKVKRDEFGKVIKDEKTPAQRLGIADKVYTWNDIIYKR